MTLHARKKPLARRIVVVAMAGFLLAGLAPVASVQAVDPTQALKTYVEQPDDSYGWTVRHQSRIGQSECIELTLTSQTWRDIVWKHRLFLILPDNLPEKTDAVMLISGSRWRDSFAEPLKEGDSPFPREAVLLEGLAQQLKAPLVAVFQVPQQPIFDGKTEDAIIAYTFDKYLETGEADWPLLLPMVKSAVRAMDAAQEYAQQEKGIAIEHFTVTGASKRGWTTWLTAAADTRVFALAPMVFDILNLKEQLPHQVRSLGGYSDRIHDYTDINLPARIDSERGRELVRMVDPYAYQQQTPQPKLVLLGTNDGFWTLDALNLYWDGLTGDKYIIYVPNADHDLASDWRRVFGGIAALHRHATQQQKMPPLKWNYDSSGSTVAISVNPGEQGATVEIWSADAPTRDFRQAKWTAHPLTANGDGQFAESFTRAADTYRAVYAEVTYTGRGMPLKLATTISVIEPTAAAASAE